MSQRGTLLTYDSATGNGLVALAGDAGAIRLPFAIAAWRSAQAPRAGMMVEVRGPSDALEFAPVSETERVQETLGNLGGALQRAVDRNLASVGSQGANLATSAVVARLGVPTLAGYGVFAGATVFAHFATVKVMGMGGGTSLYDLSTVMAQAGGGSGLRLLLWMAYLSLFVPLLWRSRGAWLAHGAPLATLLFCLYSVRSALADMQNQMGRFLGEANVPNVGDFLSLGAGFYVCLLAGLFLAARGFLQYQRNA